MAVLGTDIQCVRDIGKIFGLATGRTNLCNAIARRYQTPRRRLFYDPDYGFSLPNLLSAEMTAADVLSQGPAIEAEALKDERIETATVSLSFNAGKLTVTLQLADADGPFTLVLLASKVSVDILQVT